MEFEQLVANIQRTHHRLAEQTIHAINVGLTLRNWLMGRYIVEYELKGADRSVYGDKLIPTLANRLRALHLPACGKRQLHLYGQFYRVYPEIVRTASAQSESAIAIDSSDNIAEVIRTLSSSSTPSISLQHQMSADDNLPIAIGILLCTQKNQALMEYVLAGMDQNLFVSRYQVEMPCKAAMESFLQQQIRCNNPT